MPCHLNWVVSPLGTLRELYDTCRTRKIFFLWMTLLGAVVERSMSHNMSSFLYKHSVKRVAWTTWTDIHCHRPYSPAAQTVLSILVFCILSFSARLCRPVPNFLGYVFQKGSVICLIDRSRQFAFLHYSSRSSKRTACFSMVAQSLTSTDSKDNIQVVKHDLELIMTRWILWLSSRAESYCYMCQSSQCKLLSVVSWSNLLRKRQHIWKKFFVALGSLSLGTVSLTG